MTRSRVARAAVAAALVAAVVPLGVASGSPTRRSGLPAMQCKPVSPGSREQTCAVPLPTGVAVRSANVRVLLPADYARSRRSYPVVYMLHGVGDDETAWTNPDRGDLAKLTASCPAIFVMPDGGSGPVAGWYSDWADKSFQYERFHTAVLPAYVSSTFRTAGRGRVAVAGMSMGGFGALKYAARHRGMFRSVASYSGLVDTTFGAPVTGEFYDAAGQSPTNSLGTPSRRVWGPQSTATDEWNRHNPYYLADRLRGHALYLSTGRGAPGGSQGDSPAKVANYASEAYIGVLNERLADRLQSLRIPFADGRYTSGYHDWPYWRAAFTDSLRVLMPPIGAAARGCGA